MWDSSRGAPWRLKCPMACSDQAAWRFCPRATKATPADPGRSYYARLLTGKYMIVLYRMYGIHNVAFGLMGSAIAVTAFRSGDRWAWWALLVGNTITLVSAIRYDWIVNA